MSLTSFFSSFLIFTLSLTPGSIFMRRGSVIEKKIKQAQAHFRSLAMERSEIYGHLPISFEPNQGQTDDQVKFLSRGSGYTLFLTPTEAVLSLRNAERGMRNEELQTPDSSFSVQHSSFTTVRMKLVGANVEPQVVGLEELPGKVNYFIGDDPTNWHTNIPTYAKVKYEQVYPGVDWVYYGNRRQLEYDFVVAPGADPDVITLSFEGADELEVNANGELVVHTTGRELRQRPPVMYQEVDGVRQEIAGGYVLTDQHQVSFQVGAYDAARPLVIDPVLIYSTYLGGSGDDIGYGIAVDASGNAYVTGQTASPNFPTVTPMQPRFGGSMFDAFVTKVNASGSALVYSTYLGGSGDDGGLGIAVDGLGNAYVTGQTASPNFPTATPVQPGFGGDFDAFVTKVNASGSALVYSSYLGGGDTDRGRGIAVDAAGNAYVTGGTFSTNFPIKNPLQLANGGNLDAFIVKVSASGSALVYSTYLGGDGFDEGLGIAVDASGNAYVTGRTTSTNFPTKNPLQPGFGSVPLSGNHDAFVAKVNATGSALIYSTYLGGDLDDRGRGIAVDAVGNAYVTGRTNSTNFPTVNPLQRFNGGGFDAFVTKVNASGSALVYSTYLGGSGDENATGFQIFGAIVVDASGNAYVIGQTASTNFPTATPWQPKFGGSSYDTFITKIGDAAPARDQ